MFVHLAATPLTGFVFATRQRDYGGVHLGITHPGLASLQALATELSRTAHGHSRHVPLLPVRSELPHRIAAHLDYLQLASHR